MHWPQFTEYLPGIVGIVIGLTGVVVARRINAAQRSQR